MKELTLSTLVAVFEEMFGRALFWALVAGAILVTGLWLWVLVRDRGLSWRRFLPAQLSMPFGAAAALGLVWGATNSGPGDIGGPVDLLVMLAVAALGAVGLAVLVYVARSLVRPPRAGARAGEDRLAAAPAE